MATYGTFVDGVSLKASEVNDFFVWTTFTGVLKQGVTVATSSNASRYARVNDLIHVCYSLKSGGLGTTGAIEVDLPITAVSAAARTVGFGIFFDSDTSTTYSIVPALNSTTTVRFLTSSATSLTSYLGLANGPLITLANNDELQFSIVYEAA